MFRRVPEDGFHSTIKQKDNLYVELVDNVLDFNRSNGIANFIFLLLLPRNNLSSVSL